MLKLSFYILVLFSSVFCEVSEDYTWREYTGVVPEDAIVGGQTSEGENVYIGQIFLGEKESTVTQILDGQSKTELSNSTIKILCGSQRPVYWLRADSEHLHALLIGKHAIIGGNEKIHDPDYRDVDGFLYIGRTSYKNSVKIGKITAWDIETPRLFFNYDGKNDFPTKVYEVLIYANEPSRRGPWKRHGHRNRHGN